jgi:hypothetical protein
MVCRNGGPYNREPDRQWPCIRQLPLPKLPTHGKDLSLFVMPSANKMGLVKSTLPPRSQLGRLGQVPTHS